MEELVLVSVTGEDKPGITAAIAELLGHYDVDVLDVGQSVIHNHLSLGILVNVPASSERVFKALTELCPEDAITGIPCNLSQHPSRLQLVDIPLGGHIRDIKPGF